MGWRSGEGVEANDEEERTELEEGENYRQSMETGGVTSRYYCTLHEQMAACVRAVTFQTSRAKGEWGM